MTSVRGRRKGGWMLWSALAVGILALAAFALWRWAVAVGSAEVLDWIDARFPRDSQVRIVAEGNYGPHPSQRAAIWAPTGQAFAEPAPAAGNPPSRVVHPLVVFFHGGGWHSGAPENYRFVARTLGEHGFATALVGYRLVPEGRFPAMLEDSAAGLRWVRSHAGGAGVAGDAMRLMGHSAGAYNALMLALDPQWLASAGVPQSSIAGIVSLAGPADFYPFTSDSAVNALGHAADPLLTQPVTFARAGAPPILLMHGTADDVVRVRNSRNLAAALRAAGGEVQEIEFEDMGHAGIVMGLSKPFAQGGKVMEPLLDFLRNPGDGPAGASSVPVQGESR